ATALTSGCSAIQHRVRKGADGKPEKHPADAQEEAGEDVAGPVLTGVDAAEGDQGDDRGRDHPAHRIERTGKVAPAEDQEKVGEEPGEEDHVAARECIAIRVADDMDEARLGPWPVR